MIREFEKEGVRVRWTAVPVGLLGALEPWWSDALSRASSDAVFREYVEGSSPSVPPEASWATSAAVASVSSPPRVLPFTYRGRLMSIAIPPSYCRGAVSRADVQAAISASLGGDGVEVRVESATTLPLKLLAASSGLGCYGRNNIVYVDGFGTAHSLMGFWTDAAPAGIQPPSGAPISDSPFPGPSRLTVCSECSACVSACLSGALPYDFGLVDADRCVTLWNETERDFPESIPAGTHNALVGCVLCQACCPGNAGFMDSALILPEMTGEETGLLLSGEWSPGLRALLSRILSTDDEELLRAWAPLARRNLAAFIASGRTS